jgi:S-adenosylmethionine:diacylglycerol 3-amino-3-carboxypropyl transferase
MPGVTLSAAASVALTATSALSKLSNVTVLHTAEEELRSANAMPQMVSRLTVCVKVLPSKDAFASAAAAAAIFNDDAEEQFYALDLYLSQPTEESIAMANGLTGVHIVKASIIGVLSAKSLESVQAYLAEARSSPTYAVVNEAIVHVAAPTPSVAEVMRQQIEKDVRPLPAGASQALVKNMIEQAGEAKSEDAVTFFFRELPFVLQQQ